MVKRPALWGALLNLLGFPLYMDWLVFSEMYGGWDKAISGAAGYFVGIALHLLAAAVIVRLCIIGKGADSPRAVAVGAAPVLWGVFTLICAAQGEFGSGFAIIYDGFLYAASLGFRVYIDYFICCAEEVLFDSGIFFFCLCLLAVVSAAKRSSPRDAAKFCMGMLVSCVLLFAVHIIIGQSEHWRLVHWHSLPKWTDVMRGIICGAAFVGCGAWLAVRFVRAVRAA